MNFFPAQLHTFWRSGDVRSHLGTRDYLTSYELLVFSSTVTKKRALFTTWSNTMVDSYFLFYGSRFVVPRRKQGQR